MLWSQEVVKDGVVRAVVLNSGGANCYTGPEGFQTTHAVAEQVAAGLGIGAVDVVVCSTGLIGLANDRDELLAGVDAAHGRARPRDGGERRRHRDHDHRHGQQAGRRRGRRLDRSAAWPRAPACSRPQLATMLVVLTTDAVVDAADLDAALRAATRVSFDRLDSDGCMSTNDTVTCWPAAPPASRPTAEDFTEALTQACTDLAMQLLADAEGADHEIAITVLNAATEDDAVEVGRSVARSNLFKSAVFGKDPNWGRVLACVGTTRRRVRPRRPRRRDQRRLGLPARRRPARTRRRVDLHRPRGQRDHRPQGRRRPRHRLDQRPHPRLRPRELRLLSS